MASPGVPILLTSHEVADDSRDNGNLAEPDDIADLENNGLI